MTHRLTPALLALCTAAGLAPASGFCAGRASPAASAPSAAAQRHLEFSAKHQVPTQFTLTDEGHAPIGNAFSFIARFAGQAQTHECSLDLPKAGQVVRPGETAAGTLKCTTHWTLADDGLSYDALENGRKIGAGTLRP
jgi:hypothetical protein